MNRIDLSQDTNSLLSLLSSEDLDKNVTGGAIIRPVYIKPVYIRPILIKPIFKPIYKPIIIPISDRF